MEDNPGNQEMDRRDPISWSEVIGDVACAGVLPMITMQMQIANKELLDDIFNILPDTENPEVNNNQTVANLHQPNSSYDAQQMRPSSAETYPMDFTTNQQKQQYHDQPHTPRTNQPITPANHSEAFPPSATHSNHQAHFRHVMSPTSNPDASPPAAFAPGNPDTSTLPAFAPVNSTYQQMPPDVPYQTQQMWPANVSLPEHVAHSQMQAPFQQQAVAATYPAASAQFQQMQQPAVAIEDGHRMQFRVFYKHVAITLKGADGIISEGTRHEVYNPDGFGIYYGNLRPGLPNTVLPFPLPDVRPKPNPGKGFTPPRSLTDEDIDMIMDICEDNMQGGLHVNYEDGIIYATRYSKTTVYFWSNDKSNQSLETVKLERKIPTPVFNLHAYFARVEQLQGDLDSIFQEERPRVVFTFGFPWIPGSGKLKNMHVRAVVTPLAALKKLDRSSEGRIKNKSVEDGSLKRSDIHKSKDPESM